jgi:hypothetical protein
MEALHKDDKDGDHHKIGGMMVEFMVEPWQWRPLWCWTFTSIISVYSSKLSKWFWTFWHEVRSRGIGCHPTNKIHIEI